MTTTLSAFRSIPISYDSQLNINFSSPYFASVKSTINTLVETPEERSHSSSSPRPKERKESAVKAKRDSTNRDACQQMFLIALLLHYNYSVIIRKPRKKSTKTLQLFVVDRIMDPTGMMVYDINNFSSNSDDEKINRRNLDSHTNTTMIDLLKNHNAYFEIKKGKKAEKTSQFDRIERVNIGNQMYSYSHIKNIGVAMNDVIRENIQNNNFVFRHAQTMGICM